MTEHFNRTQENLKGSSVAGCGRWRAYGADPFTAEIEVVHGRPPRLAGHFFCDNSWSCDACGRARVAHLVSWMRGAFFPALIDASLNGALVTLTLSHTYEENWALVVDRLYDAFALLDKNMSRHYKRIGSVGKLRALEAPTGRHGLHPHLHLLLTYKNGADLSDIESTMREGWSKAVAQVGGFVNQHGFDFQADRLDEYATKMEAAHEMASHGTKAGHSKGLMIGQLLDLAGRGSKKAAAECLRVFAALGGRHRFQTGGMSKKLGIPCPTDWKDEVMKEKRAEAAESLPDPVRITYPQIHHMKATGTTGRSGLALILRSARGANAENVLRVVGALCAEVDRKETAPSDAHHLDRGTDADYQAIVDLALTRPLLPSEVLIYLEAKRRGFVLRE